MLGRAILVFSFLLTLVAGAPAAVAQSSAADAEAFVAREADAVISTLEQLQAGERELESVRAEFRARIDTLADVDRITNFVLGRYRRTASPEALEAFRSTFREYAIGVYEAELAVYAGQTLTVTGSVQRRPGDYVVQSTVAGGPDGRVFEVNWRVLEDSDGQLRVVDAQVMNIWLAQTQREQILAIIGNARGDVGAATEALHARIARRAPGANSRVEARLD